MRRPWPPLLGGLALLLVLASPALHLKLGSSGPNILPSDAPPRVAANITAAAFGEGQVAPAQVVVTDPRGVTSGPGLADLTRFVTTVQNDPEVRRVDSIVSLPPALRPTLLASNGTMTLVNVVGGHGAQATQTDTLVHRLRTDALRTLRPPETADVGGSPGLNTDLNHELEGKLIPVVGLVLLLSFFVLMLFFRSVLLPLKALLMNTASVIAAYGLMVFVFQEGHFQGALSFTHVGYIDSFLPLFQFSILFGLSMDYEVFLLARIREEYLKTGDNREAVGWGLEHTASIITSAALIMFTVFGAFAFASLVPIKSMGFGLALAVLLDATLVRVVLVPAAMRLMGRWNWWLPAWLDRRLPNVSLEGTVREPEPAPQPAGLAR